MADRLSVVELEPQKPKTKAADPQKPLTLTPEFVEAAAAYEPPPPPPTPAAAPPPKVDDLAVLKMTMRLVGLALSARALLLLGLVGAFILAVLATLGDGWKGPIVLVCYAVLVLIPLVILELRKKDS